MADLPIVLVFAPQPLSLQSPEGLPSETRQLDCRCYASDERLNEILARERPDVIVSFGRRESYPQLCGAPYHVRRRWLHFDVSAPSDDELARAGAMTFGYFLRRAFARAEPRPAHAPPLVSIFTPAFRPGDRLRRAFRSLQRQTHDHWEWVVVDDSDDEGATWRMLREIAGADPRVAVHASHRHSGRIGEVKRRACALAEGEILVELDHDDELTPHIVADIVAAFQRHPQVGFVYSDWAEVAEGTGAPLTYRDGWAFGYGSYRTEPYDGKTLSVANAPPINGTTIRHIVSAPNHVRAWRRDAYWGAGGHNAALHVADDYELVVRTFLHTEMLHIPTLGYIQHLQSGSNAQDVRRREIQRLVRSIAGHYEPQIQQRLRQLAESAPAPQAPPAGPAPAPAASMARVDAAGLERPPCVDLSVIVLDATATSLTVECLESVRRFCPGAEILLVANGVDSKARALADHYLPLDGNIGVAAAWNLAVRHATRPFLCFLNDDASFVDAETPVRLLAAARTGAIAGPSSNRAKPPQGNIAREETPAADRRVDAVVGMCLVVGRALFDRIGGFDARFLTWEDDDFCARARKEGAASVIVGGAWVTHLSGATFDVLALDIGAILRTNRQRFMQKHAPIRIVAIAKDEEDAIGGYFDQFHGVAAGCVLLDTGSTDRTMEAAVEAGARVARLTSGVEVGGFAEARNAAAALACDDGADAWIVMLDPDERLDAATIAAIPELIASAGDRVDVFLAPLEAVRADGSRRTFVPKPFLYRFSACRWRYLVHEKIAEGRQALVVNARIEHHVPLHTAARRRQAQDLYRRLAAREPYFADAAYRAAEREAWPILDYDRLDDSRIEKVHAGALVSVVIPTFDRPELCARAVASALAQDWVALEVIVVGDACPRWGTVRTAIGGHPRVRAINLPANHGAGGAAPRNVGVLAAAGDWIAYLDDDNAWDRDHVSRIMAAIRDAKSSWGFSSMRVDDDTDLGFATPVRGGIDTSCLIHAKRLWHETGPWRSRRQANDYAHDWDFVSRFLAAGEPWAASRRPTLRYNVETSGQAGFIRALARAAGGSRG